MIYKVFAVFDTKTDRYMQPFHAFSRGAAVRMFTDTVDDPSTVFHKHGADFCLMEIGEWDDETGSFTQDRPPENLGLASMFLSKENNQ